VSDPSGQVSGQLSGEVAGQDPDPPGQRFVFTYTEEELWAVRKIVASPWDRGPNWDSIWTSMFVIAFGIGFVMLAVRQLGLIALASFKPVLATAYAAFLAGAAAYHFVARRHHRRHTLRAYRLSGASSEAWSYCFDHVGIVCKSATLETRVPWCAFRSVEDWGWMVLFWLDNMQSFFIPARAFRDASAQAAFVASTAAQIKACSANGVQRNLEENNDPR
jgi:hypothetical protein